MLSSKYTRSWGEATAAALKGWKPGAEGRRFASAVAPAGHHQQQHVSRRNMSSARSRSTHPDAVDVIIDQWKRELPELASENMALIGRLRRCSILLAPRLDEVFAAYDLSNGAFDVLATLRRAGAPYILTPTELFASFMVTSGTMTTCL